MPIKSLIGELPDIVREGNREAAAILDRLSSPNRITLQTNEVVLPAKASTNIRFGTQPSRLPAGETPALPENRLIYGDNLLAMQALLAGDPQTGLPSLPTSARSPPQSSSSPMPTPGRMAPSATCECFTHAWY